MRVTTAIFISAGVAMTWEVVATGIAVWSRYRETARRRRRRPRPRR